MLECTIFKRFMMLTIVCRLSGSSLYPQSLQQMLSSGAHAHHSSSSSASASGIFMSLNNFCEAGARTCCDVILEWSHSGPSETDGCPTISMLNIRSKKSMLSGTQPGDESRTYPFVVVFPGCVERSVHYLQCTKVSIITNKQRSRQNFNTRPRKRAADLHCVGVISAAI